MSLQVRLRHALGERLVELPDRTAEEPLLVGRAKEAELKVPSVNIANQHCALFVHEGQWVVQDRSGGATSLNGKALEGSAPLSVGDLITLGSGTKPATIEVDPAGVAEGRAGHPALAQIAAQTPAARSQVGVPRQAAAARAGSYYGMVPPPPPQPRAGLASPRAIGAAANAPASAGSAFGSASSLDDIASQTVPFEGWAASESAPASAGPGKGRKPARKSSDAGAIIGISLAVAIGIAIVGSAYYLVYRHNQPLKTASATPVMAPREEDSGPKNIFTSGDGAHVSPAPRPASPAAPAEVPKPEPAVATPSADAPSPAAPSASAPPDAAAPKTDKTDSTLDEIEGAHYSSDYGRAIIKFDDYRRQHPGAFTDQLDSYTKDAVDRLWCKRIAQLCKRRITLNKNIRTKETEIRQETDAAFKTKLEDEKKEFEKELVHVEEHLITDMGYTSNEVPDPTDPPTFLKLTTDRDPMKFAAWQIRTLKYIRQNHGTLPWDGESE